ncbi:MAM domain-containing protein 2-like [Saccostrea cucullata]|uniref:MAM domain-containing protein 2-like n=1 Tax=Saccostrea cuccullata TaxID=36930 RepID=UPI002ED69FA0
MANCETLINQRRPKLTIIVNVNLDLLVRFTAPPNRSCRFEIDNEARCFFDINKSCWFRGKERVKAIAKAPKGAYGGDYFLYFDASCGKTGKKYRLYSGKGMKFEDKTYRLCLYYYIKGEGMKTFSIYTSRGETDNQKVFFVSGKRRNKWYKAQLDIHLDQETRIVVEATRGSFDLGDIAIDDVTLMPHPCVEH